MYRAIITTLGITTSLICLSHPVKAQSADSLRGTQSRIINKNHLINPAAVSNPNRARVIKTNFSSIDTSRKKTGLIDRIDVSVDESGESQLGVFPRDSSNRGDDVQVQYKLP